MNWLYWFFWLVLVVAVVVFVVWYVKSRKSGGLPMKMEESNAPAPEAPKAPESRPYDAGKPEGPQ